MKNNLMICILIFACLFCAGNLPAAEVTKDVKAAEEDKQSWDFGKVKEGEVLQHDFIINNDTGKELKIKEVSTSCGCTVSKVKKLIVPAHDSTMIEIKFDSKGYSGKIKQFVYVHTDNLDNPVLRYIISADVEK